MYRLKRITVGMPDEYIQARLTNEATREDCDHFRVWLTYRLAERYPDAMVNVWSEAWQGGHLVEFTLRDNERQSLSSQISQLSGIRAEIEQFIADKFVSCHWEWARRG